MATYNQLLIMYLLVILFAHTVTTKLKVSHVQ